MTEQDRKLVAQFRYLLEQRKVELHELTVFGSRARGDGDHDSDLDVLVVTGHDTRSVRDAISDCAWEAALGSGVVIATTVISRTDWETGPERSSLLAQAVRQDGIAA